MYLLNAASALTPAERALRAALKVGNCLNLNRGGRRREHDGVPAHDAKRLLHGPVLREVLLSVTSLPKGHVPQLIIIGADIVGPLDLRFAKIDFPIRFEDCWFSDRITLSEAVLRSVSLRDSRTQQAIDATHVRVTGDLVLDGMHVTGPLKLAGAHLEDDLHLMGATIHQPEPERAGSGGSAPREHTEARSGTPDGENTEPALLDLDNMEVKGNVLADHLTVEGRSSMNGATVGGAVQLNDAALGQAPGKRLPTEVAWSGDGLRVAGELKAKRMRADGQVSLVDARVQSLVLQDVHIKSWASRPALVMDRLQCDGSLFCKGEKRKIELLGGMKAIGIKVGAGLYLGKGEASAPGLGDRNEWAMHLRRARISDDLRCDGAFQVDGRFDIAGAQIGGSVVLHGVTIKPVEDKQIAFDAGRAQIGGNLSCGTGGAAQAFACSGTLGLRNTRIDGWVTIEESSDGGCALEASGLRVGRDARIRTSGTINLTGAKVTEDLTINLDGLIAPQDEPAADLSSLTARVLRLEGRPKGYLDLTRTSVHLLSDDPEKWCPGQPVRSWIPKWIVEHIPHLKSRRDEQRQVAEESPIVLDGLVYEDIAPISRAEKPAEMNWRLAWLEAGTKWTRMACDVDTASTDVHPGYDSPGFVPQPYQQLAAVYRRSGRDSDARDVLHTMYCRQNSIMHPVMHKGRYGRHLFLRAWNTTQNVAIGYGYRADRAIAWIVIFAAAVTLWITAFDSQAHIGVIAAAILTLGLALPGSGLDKIQHMVDMSAVGQLFAVILVLVGLVLGATVIAAMGRMIKN